MYAIIENNKFIKFIDLYQEFYNTSFPSTITDLPPGVVEVIEQTRPEEQLFKRIIQNTEPSFVDGSWILEYTIEDIEGSDLDNEMNTFKTNVGYKATQLLNNFAQQKYYDDINSACSYINSNDEDFKQQGKKAIEVRDMIWKIVDRYCKDIQSNNIPLPTSLSEVDSIFPSLSWE